MTFLTLSDEQALLIGGASTPVTVIDGSGRQLGRLVPMVHGWTPSREEIEEAERRRTLLGPGKTTKEILDQLKSIAPIPE